MSEATGEQMSGAERRQHTRVAVDWTARILQKGRGIVMGRVSNISISGCYFTAPQRFPRQAQVMMEIQLPESASTRKFFVEATVLRSSAAQGGHGHGCRFQRIRDDDLWWLVSFIAHASQREQQ